MSNNRLLVNQDSLIIYLAILLSLHHHHTLSMSLSRIVIPYVLLSVPSIVQSSAMSLIMHIIPYKNIP